MYSLDLANEALAYLSSDDGSGTPLTIETAPVPIVARIVNDINAAIQDVHNIARHLFKQRFSTSVLGPVQIPISLTSGSPVFSSSGYLSWMQGCTVKIAGETDNAFASATTLRRPYLGPTINAYATVFQDSILLDPTIGQLDAMGFFIAYADFIYPIPIKVRLAGNRSEFDRFYLWNHRFHQHALVESFPEGGELVLRMALYPLPQGPSTLNYTGFLKPTKITAANLTTEDTTTLLTPDDWDESILRPFFLKRWSCSPWFRDADVRKDLLDQYQMAVEILKAKAPVRPRLTLIPFR